MKLTSNELKQIIREEVQKELELLEQGGQERFFDKVQRALSQQHVMPAGTAPSPRPKKTAARELESMSRGVFGWILKPKKHAQKWRGPLMALTNVLSGLVPGGVECASESSIAAKCDRAVKHWAHGVPQGGAICRKNVIAYCRGEYSRTAAIDQFFLDTTELPRAIWDRLRSVPGTLPSYFASGQHVHDEFVEPIGKMQAKKWRRRVKKSKKSRQ